MLSAVICHLPFITYRLPLFILQPLACTLSLEDCTQAVFVHVYDPWYSH